MLRKSSIGLLSQPDQSATTFREGQVGTLTLKYRISYLCIIHVVDLISIKAPPMLDYYYCHFDFFTHLKEVPFGIHYLKSLKTLDFLDMSREFVIGTFPKVI